MAEKRERDLKTNPWAGAIEAAMSDVDATLARLSGRTPKPKTEPKTEKRDDKRG
jgi:hypothetical protein